MAEGVFSRGSFSFFAEQHRSYRSYRTYVYDKEGEFFGPFWSPSSGFQIVQCKETDSVVLSTVSTLMQELLQDGVRIS